MQQCGFCSLVSGLLRRAMCVGSRRGSGESYQRDSPERDPPKYDTVITDIRDELLNGRMSMDPKNARNFPCGIPDSDLALLCSLDTSYHRKFNSGKFLTIHRKKNKHLTTRSLKQELAMLDDLQHGQVKCILDQSAFWKFNAFTLETVSGGRSLSVLCVHLFHFYGLMKHFDLDAISVWKMFSLIEEGYHSTNPYHNSIHATDVTQAMHCFLQETKICENLEPVEIMASLIGAVAHDVDHPGVNQPFLIATSNHLAALYQNSSVLENHHWRTVIGCVVESGVAEQVKSVWPQLATQISSLILATDITRQKEFLARLKRYMDESNLDLTKAEDRHFVLQIALKCADISNPCRPWDISRKWSMKVCEEFFRQGDFERKLNLPITSLCDRHSNSIPKIQTGFLKFVVTPLMNEWHRFLQSDLSFTMIENLTTNQNKWDALAIQELAEETITEISDADQIDDVNESPEDISNSADLLLPKLPLLAETFKRDPYRDVRRRYSVPATPLKTVSSAGRRDSLPIAQKIVQQKILFTKENELNFKDTEFFFNSTLSLGLKAEPENMDVVKVENLLAEHSIVTITSTQVDELSLVLHGAGKKSLLRQMTFPPVMPFTRTRYLSVAGEMLSCIENSLEEMVHSNSSESSHTEANLIETDGNAKISNINIRKIETDCEKDDSCQSLLKNESSNSLEEKEDVPAYMLNTEEDLNSIPLYELPPIVSSAIVNTILNDSSDLKTETDHISDGDRKHKDIRITENFIDKIRKYDKEAFYLMTKKQEPLGRRSSAPVNAVSEITNHNILSALNSNSVKSRNRKKTLLRRSSGGSEMIKGFGLMSLDEPNRNIVLYHWSQQASCDLHQKTCENVKRRGSLPV